jgi:hypothetical protein
MRQSFKTKVLIALLTIAALATGQTAWAVNTFTVTNNGNNKFTIKRTEKTTVQTVKYRTATLSAMAGKNFTAVSGEVTFDVDEDEKLVTVDEATWSDIDQLYRFQKENRKYVFEVLDMNGFILASTVRTFTPNNIYKFANAHVNKPGLLVYYDSFDSTPTRHSYLDYYDVSYNPSSNNTHNVSDGYVWIDDSYDYSNKTLCNISTANLFSYIMDSSLGTSVIQNYLNAIGNKMYATVCFTMKEKDDGYQYIQILADNSTSFDGSDQNGTVATPSTSLYKACFELSKGETHGNTTYPKICKTDQLMNFPLQSDLTWSLSECSYFDSYLYKQAFKSEADNRDPQSGAVVLDPTVNQINVRFDAAGDNNDTWGFKDLFVRFAIVDKKAPTAKNSDIVVSSGPYQKDNRVTVSVPFSEIVTVPATGRPKLYTSWGTLDYLGGDGTNVLSFRGNITADAGTVLKVNSISGTVKDMIGNELSGSVSKTDFGSYYTSTAHYVMTDENTVISGLSEEPYLDDGTNHPAITVTFYQGTTPITLTEDTDFERTYTTGSTNDGITTITFTLTGKGSYEGSFERTFSIRNVNISDFTPHPTATNTYLIATKEDLGHLAALNDKTNFDCTGYTFLQTEDIVCDNNFATISRHNEFKGTYDGQGHSISGINITGDSYQGLFGEIKSPGIVQNVILKNCTFKVRSHVGAIAALCRGTIKNCRVESSVTIGGTQYGCDYAGGIAGSCENGTIEGCLSAAKFTDEDKYPSNNTYFGGIICSASSNAIVKNCIYTGNYISSNNKSSIVQSFTSYANPTPTITNNYYTDSNMPGGIKGTDQVGGCLGYSITLGEGIGISGEKTEYDVSGLTAYGENALEYNGVIYSGATQTVPLCHGELEGKTFNSYTSADVDINNDNTFTMPAQNVAISGNWTQLNHVTIAMNSLGIRTYASNYALDFSKVEGLTAYYASAFTSNDANGTGTLTLTPAGAVPEGEGLMLKGTADTEFEVPIINSADALSPGNLLVGLKEATEVSKKQTIGNDEYTTFILANAYNVIDWYLLAEDKYTLKANSAYLRLKSSDVYSPDGAARQIVMDFGEATGISDAPRLNDKGHKWYTLDGVILDQQPTRKGLYIRDGKKVVVK